MNSLKSLPHHPSLEHTKKEIQQWRKTRKRRSRIPEEIWEAALSLTTRYSINHVSKELKLNYRDLRNRMEDKECSGDNGFVEVELRG